MRSLDIGSGAVILLSLLYFFFGFSTLSALLVAVIIHELGHAAALYAFGAEINSLRFDISGLCMSYCGLTGRASEFVALLSGPLAGFLFAYLFSEIGREYSSEFLLMSSGFGFILSVYNLLPILPLDGGRILRCALGSILPSCKADRLCKLIGTTLTITLALFGVLNIGSEIGRAVLIAAIILLISQMKSGGLL